MRLEYKELSAPLLAKKLNVNGSVSVELSMKQAKKCIDFFKWIDEPENKSFWFLFSMIGKIITTAIASRHLFKIIVFYYQILPSYSINTENNKLIIKFENRVASSL